MPAPAADFPRKVALFSGHMVDAPDRPTPRFPPSKEAAGAAAIAGVLDEFGLGEQDLAICGGACGGDLLFAEAALARGARLEIYIPFDETIFLASSVDFAGAGWRSRFFAAKSRATLHIAPQELGPPPEGVDPYERNNRWMLEAAARFGPEKATLIGLWDGERGGKAGGAGRMFEEAQRRSLPTIRIDSKALLSRA